MLEHLQPDVETRSQLDSADTETESTHQVGDSRGWLQHFLWKFVHRGLHTSVAETSHSGSLTSKEDAAKYITPSPVAMLSTAFFLNALLGLIIVAAGQQVCDHTLPIAAAVTEH